MNRFAIVTVLGAVLCSAFAIAIEPSRVDIGSMPALNDVAGVVNKNNVIKDNNVAIASSNVAAVSDDTISLEQAGGNLPPGIFLTDDEEPLSESDKEAFESAEGNAVLQEQLRRRYRRAMFCYRRGPSTQCGWRYPMDYWFRRGRFVQGGSCGFGQAFGAFYYC
jgi:hypothetical protein